MASITTKFSFKAMLFVITCASGLFTFFYVLFRMMRHPLSWYKKKDRTITPGCLLDPSLGNHEYMTANGVKFHYVVKGSRTKPLMVLLHGFPEFWFSWREQLKHFGGDYRVVAVDLRGYGDTQRPPNKDDYTLDKLTQDIVMLIQQLGYAKCTLVAHDWGGVIAWRVVMRHPEIVQNYIVLNCPHPKVYAKAISTSCSHILKSWFIFAFQLPILPELMLSINDYEVLKKIFAKGTSSEIFPPDILEAYKYTFSRPNALTAAVNYYRCMMNSKKKKNQEESLKKTTVPTLIIWGDNDIALDKKLADVHDAVVENLTVKHIPGGSHWIQNDKPELVNEYIRRFLEEQEQKEDQL